MAEPRELNKENIAELFGRSAEPEPEPTRDGLVANTARKREEQRRLIESLHGGVVRTEGLPPIELANRDYREPLHPSGEGRPSEFTPPFDPPGGGA